MATNKSGRIALIFTAFFLFAAMTALSILNKYFGKELGIFNRSTGDVSRMFPLMINPPWPIFFIWYIVFALELVLILYGITTICRKTKGGRSIYLLSLTPPRVYGLLVANNLAVVLWLYLWNWGYTVASFIIVFSLPVTMYISFYTSLKQLFNNFAVLIQEETQSEIWVVRFLVQNGLGFISAWQTIVMFLNLGVVLRYEVGVPDEILFLALLGAMALLELAWFWLDVFVFDRYTRYILLPYIPWLATCCGLIWKWQTLFYDWGRDTITLFCCSVLALLCLTVKIIFLVYRHNKTNMQKNVDKGIEDKSEKPKEEQKADSKNKTCVTFAVENEQVNTAAENQKEAPKEDKTIAVCPVVPASEVQYNRIEMETNETTNCNTVIVHSDAIESNAMESIQRDSATAKHEMVNEEKVTEDIDVKTDKEDGDNVILTETAHEKSESKTGKDGEEIPPPPVEAEEVNAEPKQESEQLDKEEEVPPPAYDEPVQDTIPEQEVPELEEPEQASSSPTEEAVEETNNVCQNDNLIDFDDQENSVPDQTENVTEQLSTDATVTEQISTENEDDCRPPDNDSVNSTTVQIDDPMEDFEVENERNENEEPELVQTPPPLLEDDDYEGTYIVREPGLDDGYRYDPSEPEDFPQVPDTDDPLPSPPTSPASDPLPSPPTVPVSDGEEYDDSDEDEAPPVPPQDYNMPGKPYQIPAESIESQPITSNGYSEQRRPESFGTVDTAV